MFYKRSMAACLIDAVILFANGLIIARYVRVRSYSLRSLDSEHLEILSTLQPLKRDCGIFERFKYLMETSSGGDDSLLRWKRNLRDPLLFLSAAS